MPPTAAPTSTACAIRYRLDRPGPAAFLVDCAGELRVYARGELGGALPRSLVQALLAERGSRWIPASGSLLLDFADERPVANAQHQPLAGGELSRVIGAGVGAEAAPLC